MGVRLKRVYEDPAPSDGYRVLVDRLWPRGLSRTRARIDWWLKDVAPSPALRAWWGHDPARLDEFSARYRGELDENPVVDDLLDMVRDRATVSLLYAARDNSVNHARVLRDYLVERLAQEHDPSPIPPI